MKKFILSTSYIFCGLFCASSIFAAATSIQLQAPLTKCTLDVSNPGQGVDISDNYANYPDPFLQNFTPAPGVTLPGLARAQKCNWIKEGDPNPDNKIVFTWNAKNEQCILNGNYGQKSGCSTGKPIDQNLLKQWTGYADQGKTVLLNIPGEGQQKVMLAYGHGVLTGSCGDVAIVKQTVQTSGGGSTTNYAAVLQVGPRAWSYEISAPAQTHLAPDNYGGTCYIPDVALVDPKDIQAIMNAPAATSK